MFQDTVNALTNQNTILESQLNSARDESNANNNEQDNTKVSWSCDNVSLLMVQLVPKYFIYVAVSHK